MSLWFPFQLPIKSIVSLTKLSIMCVKAYLWLSCQALAGMKLRLFFPLDPVTDVTILEVPEGQLGSCRSLRFV